MTETMTTGTINLADAFRGEEHHAREPRNVIYDRYAGFFDDLYTG